MNYELFPDMFSLFNYFEGDGFLVRLLYANKVETGGEIACYGVAYYNVMVAWMCCRICMRVQQTACQV